MRSYVLGLLACVVTVFVTATYVYLSAQQSLKLLREFPNCFPPFTLMRNDVDARLGEPTVPMFGYDDGLRDRDQIPGQRRCSHELSP